MVAIISPRYCSPNPIDLAIVRQVFTITHGNFVVTDINGNTIFKVQGSSSLPARRLLLDAAGNPIVTLRQKIMTAHSRWQVFRGNSIDSKDLLFSAKTSSLVYVKTKLDVFLANNTAENVSDFTVQGSWFQRSCVIYAGGSSVIAKMHKKHTAQSLVLGKDNLMVTVNPNNDHAFIVALVVILDEINNQRQKVGL